MRHLVGLFRVLSPRRTGLAGALVVVFSLALVATAGGADEQVFRTLTGRGNNLSNPDWGSAGVPLSRVAPAAYADGIAEPAGTHRPGAREISNMLFAQSDSLPNDRQLTDIVWLWGQFLDHDLDLTGAAQPAEPFPIPVPPGDPVFDPFGTGTMFLPFSRSLYAPAGSTPARQQINQITAFIDGSNVYGSDEARARALRTLDGTGRLATSAGDLLPFNTAGLPNEPSSADAGLFLAGDVRANEQVGLTALHTLFVREHNYWAGRLGRPNLSGDEIYQRARAMVGAIIQSITYNEFLPAVLGPGALARYQGYRESVNPGIANEFSTAAYRFGHSMVPPTLLRLDRSLQPIPAGDLKLVEAFFNPREIIDNGGIDPILRGAAHQVAQEVDARLVDGIRNMLFGMPGTIGSGTDLASLNIQRGRDHGVSDYNSVRRALGLPPARSVADITADDETQLQLLLLYPDVNDIDLWVGGIAEDHVAGALVGETFWHLIRNQFTALRDGDRFWYEYQMSMSDRRAVERTRLIDVIRRNTGIGGEVPENLWQADSRGQ
jgi:hypothetical protein